MKQFFLTIAATLCTAVGWAQSQEEMKAVYDDARTPYKYGLVVAPKDGNHMTDCPTVFRIGERWYMTYVIFDGKGYETWLSTSDDLLHWREVGCLLPFREGTWDKQQRAGFPALTQWTWGSDDQTLGTLDGRYWMSYFGGENKGYEAQPLHIGMANVDAKAFEQKLRDGSRQLEWDVLDAPVLSPKDSSVQWWETGTHYKPLVYRDTARTLGHEYLLYYNAYGRHPETGLGAERIGLALSDDLRHWTRYAGNPVFHHEVKGTITGDAQIVKFREASANEPPLYVMFYFRAFDPSRPYAAYNTFSCSHDLIHWEDWQGDDLIWPTEAYDDLFSHKTFILKWQGVVYHFFCAVDKDMRRGIAVATSQDFGKSELHFPHPFRMGNGFTSHCVLQAGREVELWGEAPVGATVDVTLAKKRFKVVADGHGRWEVRLPRQKPSVKPVKITATCNGETEEIIDVVFGDVWLAAGNAADTTNMQRLKLSAADTEVRMLLTPTSGEWTDWQLSPIRTHSKAKRVVGIISATAPGAKVNSFATESGKWQKILLRPMAPYAIRGILWYSNTAAPSNPELLQKAENYLRTLMDSPDAEFRK
ncbi:MAG: hypothetical protein K6E73_08625 [Bacteroidales bacterium]|nr:hypothetical protein [Bacteroidales bacterium]